MKVLITGGLGFIGSRLASALIKDGHEVIIIDHSKRTVSSLISSFVGYVIHHDIADQEIWKEVPPCGIVFHAAAAVSAVESEKDPDTDFRTNVMGTHNVALYAAQYDARVIFCSSIRVYDPDDIETRMERFGKVSEGCNLVNQARNPQPPFANNKLMAEEILRARAFQDDLGVIIHRMSSIVGPGQSGRQVHGWVSYLVKCAVKGIPYTIFGDGNQVRDILHVDDLVGLVQFEIEEWEKSHWVALSVLGGATYNVGGGPKLALSLNDVIKILKERHGFTLQVSHGEPRTGEPENYVSDTSDIERCGWKRQHEDPQEIIAQLVNQYK